MSAFEVLAFILFTAGGLYLAMRRLGHRLLREHVALAQANALAQQQFHALPCPAWVYDLDTLGILDANQAALEFFGTSRQELLQRTLRSLWPDAQLEQLDEILALIRTSAADGYVLTQDLSTRYGPRHAEIRSNPLQLPSGPARLVVAIDRSAEQQALRHRSEALARLQEAQAIAHLGSWELDPRTRLGDYSDEAYRILSRPVPAQRRHRLEDLLVGSDLDTQARIDRLLEDLYSGRAAQADVLLSLIDGNGQRRMIQLCAKTVGSDEATAIVHGTLQDVTEREHSRLQLREREEQFGELVRVLPDGVLILSEERVIYANAAASDQFDFNAETILGKPLRALVATTDYPRISRLLRGEVSAADAAPTPHAMRRGDGSMFHAGLAVGRVRYDGHECHLLVVRDLSEPERMRDALAESNAELQAMARRLFSLQEDERRAISRDLHDDIGQAITAMKLSAHAAIDEDDPARRREDLAGVVELADSTVVKLRNLSMLLRPPQLDALGLEAALRWQATLLFRASPVRLALDIAPLPRRPHHEVEQACFRIAQESLTNAMRHACAGEVTLTLRLRGEQLALQVADDGDGFDPDGPRGLGLIMMRERAQSSGGTLQIDSAPGAGTRVSLLLPYPCSQDNGC
ncbi:MAG: PAS domain-containing protein [Pseudomonas sp.]